MAALWDMQEVSSLTRDWLCSLKKKKKPVKASNILISCLFSTFGSLKIIQTFHRVWTTRELQSFSKYTKCVPHSGRVIWADREPWKSTAPGKSCLWTNWWDLKDVWLLSLNTFQNPTGKWLTQPWVGSHELWTPWQSGPHICLQSLESSKAVTLGHMVTVEQHPAWEHIPLRAPSRSCLTVHVRQYTLGASSARLTALGGMDDTTSRA